jgi:hypothetical protein
MAWLGLGGAFLCVGAVQLHTELADKPRDPYLTPILFLVTMLLWGAFFAADATLPQREGLGFKLLMAMRGVLAVCTVLGILYFGVFLA